MDAELEYGPSVSVTGLLGISPMTPISPFRAKRQDLPEGERKKTRLENAEHDAAKWRDKYEQTKKAAADSEDKVANLRRRVESLKDTNTAFHTANSKLKEEIQKLLAEKEGRGRDGDEIPRTGSPYLRQGAVDGLPSSFKDSIEAQIRARRFFFAE